jgi:hypothetical protein
MCKIITLAQLKAAGACADALQRFAAAFGESTPVTPSLACKHADQFDWDWAADNLLSAAAQVEYDQAVKRAQVEYETAAAPARVKYAAAAAPALALLNSPPSEQDGVARAHLWAKYDRDRERAQVEYDRAAAAALAEYDRTCARAWAHLYIKEGI